MAEGDWIRTPQARALLWATLAMSLVLGAAFVALERATEPAVHDVAPLTDEQSAAQVVNSAREIVAAARLSGATGGYAFVSCINATDAPYQPVLDMTFALPQGNWVRYLDEVNASMVGDGWTESPATSEHFGHKLTRDGVTSVFHRQPDATGFAVMRLYGECRNTGDHRDDDPAWTEVDF